MTTRTAGSASGARWRGGLVVVQLALTLVLLVGAGLLGGSLFRLLSVDPGFRTQQLVLVDLTHPAPGDDEGRARLAQQQSCASAWPRCPAWSEWARSTGCP